MSHWQEDEIHQRYDRGEEITAKDVIDFYQLIPTTEPKPLNYNTWSMCSSNEHSNYSEVTKSPGQLSIRHL